MQRIDMHVHTNASDGVLSPTEIVHWSFKLGLKAVAITDHDTVDGVQEAIDASKNYNNFSVIPGIEFSTLYNNNEVHILGYFIDIKNEHIIEITKAIKNHRANRAIGMIDALRAMNIDITFEEIVSKSEEPAIGRPHIARVLVEKGYVKSIQEAFDIYLDRGKPAYVSRYKLSLEESIEIIKNAKGFPVLAHPGLLDSDLDLRAIIQKGIEGIEVYHTQHAEKDNELFLAIAKQMNLIVTGGSDYHHGMLDGIPTIGSASIDFNYLLDQIKNIKSLDML